MPSSTLEEYLETIYKLSQRGAVKPTQIAEAIGVSGPTVTATLRRLESHGLVTREGTQVLLTDEGMARSLAIVRRHRLAERFLVDVLGLPWEDAHEDACLLEHALSERVLSALELYMDNPDVCPHGYPIPKADGSIAAVSGVSLADVEPGASATVVMVGEDDEGLLGYMGQLGLRPGAPVRVLAVAPFGGPVTIELEGESKAISRELAASVMVAETTS
jgi:DtxR family Mn-dependent transcriptional regulator